jgi:hypothetical protein
MKIESTVCIIASHTVTSLKKLLIKHNIKYLQLISSKIFIVASTEFPLELSDVTDDVENSNVEIMHVPNDSKNLCYKKYCAWYNLYSDDLNKYTDFIFTNDSILFTRELNDFQKLFNPNCEMTGLVASNELQYHYPDFLRRYNLIGLHKVMNYYINNLGKYDNIFALIVNFEVQVMNLFQKSDIRVLYDTEKDHTCNIHYHEECINKYLFKLNYPVIKIKTLLSPRYYNIVPNDFNPEEYKDINKDLINLSLEQCKDHFIKFGMQEGRLYKKQMTEILCKTLKDYIHNNSNLFWIQKYIQNQTCSKPVIL